MWFSSIPPSVSICLYRGQSCCLNVYIVWTTWLLNLDHVAFPFFIFTPYPLEPFLHLHPYLSPYGTPQHLAMLVVNQEEKLTFYFLLYLRPQQPLALLTSVYYIFLLKFYIPSIICGITNFLDCKFMSVKEIKTLVRMPNTHIHIYKWIFFSLLSGVMWSKLGLRAGIWVLVKPLLAMNMRKLKKQTNKKPTKEWNLSVTQVSRWWKVWNNTTYVRAFLWGLNKSIHAKWLVQSQC